MFLHRTIACSFLPRCPRGTAATVCIRTRRCPPKKQSTDAVTQSRGSLFLLRFLQVGSVVVPLALLSLWGWRSWHSEHEHALRDAQRNAEIAGEHVLKVIQTQERILAHVDDMIAGRSWEEIAASDRLHAWLEALARQVDNISGIWLVDPVGEVRNGSHDLPRRTISFADRDYFIGLQGFDYGLYIGERHAGRVTGSDIFAVAQRRKGIGFNGVIVTSVLTGSLDKFFRGIGEGEGAVSVIRADGRLLARSPQRDPMTFSPQSGIMRAIAAADGGTFEAAAESDGIERFYAYRRVGGFPLYVTYGVPRSAVTAKWLHDMILNGTAALLLAVFALGLTTVLLRQTRAEAALRERLETEVERRTAELRRAAADKDVLLREVHHRVKNNFQVVASLLRIQLRLGQDPWEGLRQSLTRIHSMGLVHQQLYQTPDLSRLDLPTYLRTLAEHFATAQGAAARNITWDVAGGPLAVTLDEAIPIALIVSEVLSNAFKHAFPSDRGGRVEIEVTPTRDQLTLRVRDNGVGAPTAFETGKTLGLRLIAALAGQLDASYAFRFDGGTEFTLLVPAKGAVQSTAA